MTAQYYSFLGSLSQVTFTAVGLVLLAIAADPNTRNHWFGDRARSLYTTRMLLYFLLPGFYAIFAGLPIDEASSYLLWCIVTIVIAIFYLLIPGMVLYVIQKHHNINIDEYKRLEKEIDKGSIYVYIGGGILVMAVLGLLFSVYGMFLQVFVFITNMTISFSLASSIFQVIDFMRESTHASKKTEEIIRAERNKSLVAVKTNKETKTISSFGGMLILFNIIIAFLIALFFYKQRES